MPAEQIGEPRRRMPPTGAAREHLANERTLLAWARTAVTLVTLGFGVARFGAFVAEESHGSAAREGAVIGVALGAIGVASMAVSVVRFLRARSQIGEGRFRAELWPEALLTVLTAALGVSVITYLLLNG